MPIIYTRLLFCILLWSGWARYLPDDSGQDVVVERFEGAEYYLSSEKVLRFFGGHARVSGVRHTWKLKVCRIVV